MCINPCLLRINRISLWFTHVSHHRLPQRKYNLYEQLYSHRLFCYGRMDCLGNFKGRDTLTPLPFVVMQGMLWQRRFASYFVNIRELSFFTPDPMFTNYEADLLCQSITFITTKSRGVRVSHPVNQKVYHCGKSLLMDQNNEGT